MGTSQFVLQWRRNQGRVRRSDFPLCSLGLDHVPGLWEEAAETHTDLSKSDLHSEIVNILTSFISADSIKSHKRKLESWRAINASSFFFGAILATFPPRGAGAWSTDETVYVLKSGAARGFWTRLSHQTIESVAAWMADVSPGVLCVSRKPLHLCCWRPHSPFELRLDGCQPQPQGCLFLSEKTIVRCNYSV